MSGGSSDKESVGSLAGFIVQDGFVKYSDWTSDAIFSSSPRSIESGDGSSLADFVDDNEGYGDGGVDIIVSAGEEEDEDGSIGSLTEFIDDEPPEYFIDTDAEFEDCEDDDITTPGDFGEALVVLPGADEEAGLVSWAKGYVHEVKNPTFLKVLTTVLRALADLSPDILLLQPKKMVTWYLNTCNGLYMELAGIICSFLPENVSTRLDRKPWGLRGILSEAGNWKRITRKGHYLLGASSNDKFSNLASYIGVAIGKNGLQQRLQNHFSPSHRVSHKSKWFYKLLSGDADGIRRPVLKAVPIILFPKVTST
jgi:hypothetical protein